uniref:Uncharacterized protein n=1 Tax=Cacopsylla melanoneura TaxID=428564 RepID=A0A8D8Q8T5_9HEMI
MAVEVPDNRSYDPRISLYTLVTSQCRLRGKIWGNILVLQHIGERLRHVCSSWERLDRRHGEVRLGTLYMMRAGTWLGDSLFQNGRSFCRTWSNEGRFGTSGFA